MELLATIKADATAALQKAGTVLDSVITSAEAGTKLGGEAIEDVKNYAPLALEFVPNAWRGKVNDVLGAVTNGEAATLDEEASAALGVAKLRVDSLVGGALKAVGAW